MKIVQIKEHQNKSTALKNSSNYPIVQTAVVQTE